MTKADEKFFAWLDGELDPAQAAEMEARVAADPELGALAEQHRAFGARLSAAFDPIVEAPVPERLTALIQPREAEVIDFAAVRERREKRRLWAFMPQAAAMAASLAIGLVAGAQLYQSPAGGPVELQGGRMIAAASLDEALDTQLASAPLVDVRIGVTFRDSEGTLCRSFVADASSGLACRDGKDWRVRGLFAAPEGQSSDYRMASGMDPNLAALIDSTIDGEPLDATQERQALKRGWK